MKLFNCPFILIVLLSIFSCGEQNEVDIEPTIIGKWADLSDHPTTQVVDGVPQTVTFPDIEYVFNDDGTYIVNNDAWFGIFRNGTWIFDEEERKLDFFLQQGTPTDSTLGIHQTFEWEILNLGTQSLEVNYIFTQDSTDSLPPFNMEVLRNFERVE